MSNGSARSGRWSLDRSASGIEGPARLRAIPDGDAKKILLRSIERARKVLLPSPVVRAVRLGLIAPDLGLLVITLLIGHRENTRSLSYPRASLPTLYLLIILASVVEPNFWWLLGLLLLFSWMQLVGVVRAEFLRTRNFDYVRAARALGARDLVIMFKHILPNAMVATLSYLPFILAGAITSLTALDFLGFGLPPGSASLGELLNQGKRNLHAPWLGLSAFFALATMLSLLIFVGEGVRDAFDPRKIFKAERPPGDSDAAAPQADGAP